MYGCYNSQSVLKAGNFIKKSNVMREILQLCMPLGQDDNHLLHVDIFLGGTDKYHYMFELVANMESSRSIPGIIMHYMVGENNYWDGRCQ